MSDWLAVANSITSQPMCAPVPVATAAAAAAHYSITSVHRQWAQSVTFYSVYSSASAGVTAKTT